MSRSAIGPSHIFPGAGAVETTSEVVPVAPVAAVSPSSVETVARETPAWSASMKKADLLAVALGKNLPVTSASTKAEILAALEGTAP